MRRPLLMGLLKASLGLAVMAYVVWRNWRPASGAGLADLLAEPPRVGPLLLAALFCGLAVGLTFVRWWVLVRAAGLQLSLGEAVRLGIVGYYFNALLPGSVGGDLVKAVALARQQARRSVAVATVIFDRVLGLYALALLVAVLGGFLLLNREPVLVDNAGLQVIVRASALAAGAGALAWAALGLLPAARVERFANRLRRIPKLGNSLAGAWEAVASYRQTTGPVLLALAMAVIGHSLLVLSFHYSARIAPSGDGPRPPGLAEHLVIVPVGTVIKSVPLLPGGAGVGELGFGKLYALLGQPESRGVLASLAQLALTWALGGIGYVVYLATGAAKTTPAA